MSYRFKVANVAGSSASIVKERYVSAVGAGLPLLVDPDAGSMRKHECPLCGGELVPMGWFRSGGLHELQHQCERCGLAVFR